jgi:NAD(P)-dependent dehydrogenase (short-subunit alcohol dehydrogenase family)
MTSPENGAVEKIALITGGSRGIGRAVVLALAASGWRVVFAYRTGAEAAQDVLAALEGSGAPGLAVQADIARPADREHLINATLDAFGGIDLLVNNAGMAPRQRVDLLEMSEASYEEVMRVNLAGPFFLTQRVARLMVEQSAAAQSAAAQSAAADAVTPTIINIGSISAYTSSTMRGEYCLSKAGMGMMTALFADRLAGYGIRVYEIRPGIIATDMTAGVRERYDRMMEEGLLPIRRWGQPEDVARAVVGLAGGLLPYSTGEVINIDGGFHIRRL